MRWLNEPPHWSAHDNEITITAEPNTDFWRVTRHGFITDNGHFYYREVTGDFTAHVQFTAQYEALYDQAGLMIRVDEKTWCKCGIEKIDDKALPSVVVTRDFSDWSTASQTPDTGSIWFKLQRIGSAIEVSYSLDGAAYTMLREAYFSDVETIQVGVMCASPRGAGFEARFTDLSIE